MAEPEESEEFTYDYDPKQDNDEENRFIIIDIYYFINA